MRFVSITSALLKAIVLVSLALLIGACDTDSPTAPSQEQPAPAPGTAPPSTAWTVQLTATPNRIGIDGVNAVSTTIAISVRRTDNGQPAPTGSTIVLSTSQGNLTNAAGTVGTSVPVGLTNGQGVVTLSVAGTTAGTVVIQGQIESSFGQTTVTLEALPEPDVLFIDSISPTIGSPNGGTRVTINGSGFDTPVRVLFGGVPGVVESVSPNQVIATTPAIDLPVGTTQTVAVQVTINVNEAGTASDILGNAFTYTRNGNITPDVDPRIISITPRSGPNEGGTRVTIFGEEFSSSVQVLFGIGTTRIEAEVLDISSTRIIVRTPSATGPNSGNQDSIVDLQVTNLDTGRQATFVGAFQYGSPDQQVLITSISPSEGLYLGGDLVTIFGQGFDEPVAVGLAGIGQNIISVSGTEIVVRTVPAEIVNCTDVSGPTSVVNIETGSGDLTGPAWTYEVFPPVIFNVSPDSVLGAGGGGTTTISGAGFFPPMTVAFVFEGDGSPGPINVGATVIDPTTIEATIPSSPVPFPTVACDDDGDGTEGSRFVDLFADITVTNPFTGCTTTFENGFVYRPEDTSCRNDSGVVAEPVAAAFSFTGRAEESTDEFIVSFSNNTTPPDFTGMTFLWEFLDSFGSPDETTTEPAPHSYPLQDSAYQVQVRLTVTRGAEVSRVTETIDIPATTDVTPPPPPPPVGDPPVASFTFIVSGLDVDFTNTSMNVEALSTISWDFGDGTSSISFNPPTKTYAAAGTYTVSMTVSGPNGTDTDTQDVTVP